MELPEENLIEIDTLFDPPQHEHDFVINEARKIEGRRVEMEVKLCLDCGQHYCASEKDTYELKRVNINSSRWS